MFRMPSAVMRTSRVVPGTVTGAKSRAQRSATRGKRARSRLSSCPGRSVRREASTSRSCPGGVSSTMPASTSAVSDGIVDAIPAEPRLLGYFFKRLSYASAYRHPHVRTQRPSGASARPGRWQEMAAEPKIEVHHRASAVSEPAVGEMAEEERALRCAFAKFLREAGSSTTIATLLSMADVGAASNGAVEVDGASKSMQSTTFARRTALAELVTSKLSSNALAKLYDAAEKMGTEEERAALVACFQPLCHSSLQFSNPFKDRAVCLLNDSCLEAICLLLRPQDIPFVNVTAKSFAVAVKNAEQQVPAFRAPVDVKHVFTSVQLLEYAINRLYLDWDRFQVRAAEYAAACGNLDVVKWTEAQGHSVNVGVTFCAAEFGHVHIIEYALAKGVAKHNRTTSYPASRGDLATVKWLKARDFPWDAHTCAQAALSGNLELLQWVREQGCRWDQFTCSRAASGGNVEVLKWARANGCRWSSFTCEAAAENGHLACLEWAWENGCEWTNNIVERAASGGHIHVLTWLKEHGVDWNKFTIAAAAKGGHLDCVKFLHASGCPWSACACADAAAGGHLDVLKWLRANGCPWDGYTRKGAIDNGHYHIARWAKFHGCPERGW